MKTILVPTDYSETADNALQYAIELAALSNAKIILFHAYHVPVPTTEMPVFLISPQEIEKENSKRIKQLEKKIAGDVSRKIKVESLAKAGFAADHIVEVALQKNADLIVMGITGGSKTMKTLIGSNTTTVMKNTQIPVLMIPKQARYKKIEKIVLACDYNSNMDENVLRKIKEFKQLFKAKLLAIDVVTPSEVPAYENEIAGLKLEHALQAISHTTFLPHAENITDEINSFVDMHKCDWLIMIPHKYKLLSGLFHKSNTKQMAFHTHIPLLSIHD